MILIGTSLLPIFVIVINLISTKIAPQLINFFVFDNNWYKSSYVLISPRGCLQKVMDIFILYYGALQQPSPLILYNTEYFNVYYNM
jgi:hypothetical protein